MCGCGGRRGAAPPRPKKPMQVVLTRKVKTFTYQMTGQVSVEVVFTTQKGQ